MVLSSYCKKTAVADYDKTHADLFYSALQARHNYYSYTTTLHTTTQNATQYRGYNIGFKLLHIDHSTV